MTPTDCPASSYPPGATSGTLSRRPATSEMSPPCAGRDTVGGTSSLPSWELLHECPTHPAGPCYRQGCLPCSYWSRLAERWQDRALDAEARVRDLEEAAMPRRSIGANLMSRPPVHDPEVAADAPSWDDLCESMTGWVVDHVSDVFSEPRQVVPAVMRLTPAERTAALVAALAGLSIAGGTLTVEQLWGWTRQPVALGPALPPPALPRRPAGPVPDPAPCGTTAAARRHYRRGEPLCEPCRLAQARHVRDRRAGRAA